MDGKHLLDLPLLQPVHVEMDAICGAQWLVTGRARVEQRRRAAARLPSLSEPELPNSMLDYYVWVLVRWIGKRSWVADWGKWSAFGGLQGMVGGWMVFVVGELAWSSSSRQLRRACALPG
jgi:hypothetical protein